MESEHQIFEDLNKYIRRLTKTTLIQIAIMH